MIGTLSVKICKSLVKNNIIKFDDFQTYIKKLQKIILLILDVIGFIVIGILFNCLSQMMLFIISFRIMRMFAGGCWLSNYIKNFICFSTLALISVYISSVNEISGNNIIITIVLMIIALVIFFKQAPYKLKFSSCSKEKRKKLRRNTFIAYFLQALVVLILFLINKNLSSYSCTIAFAIFIQSVTLL